MGFGTGSFAKVWDVKSYSDTCTSVRISVGRRDKNSGNYQKEFAGYVFFIGSGNAVQAAKLKEGDTIKLGRTDTSNYDKDNHWTERNTYRCFSFEKVESFSHGNNMSVEDAAATSAENIAAAIESDATSESADELPF